MKNIVDSWELGEMRVVQVNGRGLIFETELPGNESLVIEEFKNLVEGRNLSFTASASWIRNGKPGSTNLYINVDPDTVDRVGLDTIMKEVKEKIESPLALEHKIIRHRPVSG